MMGPPGAVAVLETNATTCEMSIPNYPATPLPFEFLRGQLSYEEFYNEAGTLLKKKSYNYQYRDNLLTTPATIVVNVPKLWGTDYELITARKTVTEITEVNYSPNGNQTEHYTEYHESNYHNGVTKKVNVNSNGDLLTAKFKFAFDYSVPACDALDNGLTTYINKINSAKNTFEQALIEANLYNRGNRYVAFQQYRKAKSDARLALINLRKLNFVNSNSNYKQAHDAAKIAASAILKPILQLQDNFQNLPVETNSWKNNNLLNSSFISYASNIGIVVYPIKSEMINLATPSPTFVISSYSNNSILKDGRYTNENFITFLNGNILEQQKTNDLKQSYIWGYNNQYPIASVGNSAVKDIFHTSFEETEGNSTTGDARTGKLSRIGGYTKALSNLTAGTYILSYWQKSGSTWNYIESKVPVTGTTHTITVPTNIQLDELRLYPSTAQMTTYTYEPLIGMTSQCDANNKITYYEYDGFGRLKTIRDQDRNVIKNMDYQYQKPNNQ